MRLLQIELLKIRHNKAALSFSIIYFGILIALCLIGIFPFKLGPIDVDLSKEGMFDFPQIWHFTAYIAGFLKFFLAIIIISSITDEYSNRTIKQNLIDGLSKREFIQSKFQMVILYPFISFIILGVTTLILGYTHSENIELAVAFKEVYFLFAYWLELTMFMSLALFLGMFFKKSSTATLMIFGIAIIEGILIGAEFLFKKFALNTEIESDIFLNKVLPYSVNSNLIQQPFSRLNTLESFTNMADISFNYDIAPLSVILNLAYIALFGYLSLYLLKKRDL